MYLYIYDSFLSHQKYETLLNAIERRVTDLGIAGKIARLTVLKNVRELISDAVKGGVKTIVAIGDDQTFTKMINVVADMNVVLGLVPITNKSNIARVLGVPPRELACDVIAARVIRRIDLGRINDYFFIDSAELKNANVKITCGGFSIAPITAHNTVMICNVGRPPCEASNPTDGVLEAVIVPSRSGLLGKRDLTPTVLPFTSLRIVAEGDDAPIITDQQAVLKTPAHVEVAPKKLRVIVGSNRLFD